MGAPAELPRVGREAAAAARACALRLGEFIAVGVHRRRTSAGFLLLVHDGKDAAVLEHHPLSRLHAIDSAIKDTGHQHVRRIHAGIIDAGIAMLTKAHLHIRRAGRANQDAEIGR